VVVVVEVLVVVVVLPFLVEFEEVDDESFHGSSTR
jgi:hypothetical protein